MTSFRPRTFLERVAIAARETVFSGALGWLLDDESPLPLSRRAEILHRLTDSDVGRAISIRAETEWTGAKQKGRKGRRRERLDLLLRVEREGRATLHVAVENKIKSVEGEQQLSRYDAPLSALPGEVSKVFLTLTGDAPASGTGWRPVSYAALLEFVTSDDARDPFVDGLRVSIERLIAVARAAVADAVLAEAAFEDDGGRTSELTQYVAAVRLENVVQRLWMSQLGAALSVELPWRARVDETRGQALLDIEAELQDRPGYRVGLQVQRRQLKAFCSPYPYPAKASPEQHAAVAAVLDSMRGQLRVSAAARPTRAKARGFRSFVIGKLPNGRVQREWVAALGPYVADIRRIVPTVRAVLPGTVSDEAADDDGEGDCWRLLRGVPEPDVHRP